MPRACTAHKTRESWRLHRPLGRVPLLAENMLLDRCCPGGRTVVADLDGRLAI
jgi:hypothetical protein